MTVQELIDELSSYDPEAEVRLASQPSWPFQHNIIGLIEGRDAASRDAEEEGLSDTDETGVPDFDGPVDPRTVYILEGRQLGYFSKAAWNR